MPNVQVHAISLVGGRLRVHVGGLREIQRAKSTLAFGIRDFVDVARYSRPEP